MKIASLPYIFVVALLAATTALCVVVHPSEYVRMELVDRFVRKAPDGQKSIYYFVSVNRQDSSMISRYTYEMFHHEVSDSVSAQVPVEMVFYFFNESRLEPLEPARLMQMSGGDPAQVARLRNLAIDTSGYFAVRFSDLYRMFGRDSLYIVKGDVIIPHNGKQLKDFITPTTTNE